MAQWRETFVDAVKIRLRSDVPVGSCLSGGIDSSGIVGAMRFLRGEGSDPIYTVTSCYEDPKYDESTYADIVSRYARTVSVKVYPYREHHLTEDLKTLAYIQEQPFPNLSMYSQFCVMRAAKEMGIKVLLDGQGGDELFLGYDSCQVLRVASIAMKGKFLKALAEARLLAVNNPRLSLISIIGLGAYWSTPSVRSFVSRMRARDTISDDFAKERRRDLPDFMRKPADFLELRRRWLEEWPLPALLHYEDRNSMAHSVETRLPL